MKTEKKQVVKTITNERNETLTIELCLLDEIEMIRVNQLFSKDITALKLFMVGIKTTYYKTLDNYYFFIINR